jgi:hypothetical protein
MKLLHGLLAVLVAAWGVSEARAQLGLYGAPEPLPLPAMQGVAYGQPAAPAADQPVAANFAQANYQVADAQGMPPGAIPPAPAVPVPGQFYTPVIGPAPASVSGASVIGEPSSATGAQPPEPACAGCAGASGSAGGCLAPLGCAEGGCSAWYATVLGLVMTRDQPNKLFTTAQTNALENQWTDNHFDWVGGGEIRIGHRFCCDQWAIEASYWGLSDFNTSACPNIPGPYSTPFTMKWVDVLGTHNGDGAVANPSTTADEWFDASTQNRIQRSGDVNNVEINLIRYSLCGGRCGDCACAPLTIDALAGFRFFRFSDQLIFSAQHGAYDSYGVADSPYQGDWIFLNDEIANNLWGFQIGFNAEYHFNRCVKFFVTPKVGLYDNHMTLNYNLYAQDQAGNYYQGSSPTYKPLDYPIHACADGLSILTQVDVGLNWDISCHWEAMVGYRLVAVTGVGLADNQVPFYGNDTQAVACIDKNGSLLVHGAFAGLTFTY